MLVEIVTVATYILDGNAHHSNLHLYHSRRRQHRMGNK